MASPGEGTEIQRQNIDIWVMAELHGRIGPVTYMFQSDLLQRMDEGKYPKPSIGYEGI